MDASTVITLLTSSVITGLGISFGFWFASRMFLKEVIKKMPEWIQEIISENKKRLAVEEALHVMRK